MTVKKEFDEFDEDKDEGSKIFSNWILKDSPHTAATFIDELWEKNLDRDGLEHSSLLLILEILHQSILVGCLCHYFIRFYT